MPAIAAVLGLLVAASWLSGRGRRHVSMAVILALAAGVLVYRGGLAWWGAELAWNSI